MCLYLYLYWCRYLTIRTIFSPFSFIFDCCVFQISFPTTNAIFSQLWFSSNPPHRWKSIIITHCSQFLAWHKPGQITTHRSEVVPEYEPGGAGGQTHTANCQVEQTNCKETCTAGNAKHRDQAFFTQLGTSSRWSEWRLLGPTEALWGGEVGRWGAASMSGGVNREHFQNLPFLVQNSGRKTSINVDFSVFSPKKSI